MRATPLLPRNGLIYVASGRRSLSTAAAQSIPGTLPLEGIRVLDMTRVLAGV